METDVKIAWGPPAYDGGKPVTAYTIKILPQGSSTYMADPACDGADATIKANRYCLIPMSTLRAPSGNFNLQRDATVKAIVTATNEIGESIASTPNDLGAVVKTEPAAPPPAVPVAEETSDTRITVSYPAPDTHPENGGSPITSLGLWWDAGTTADPTKTTSWTALSGVSTDSLDSKFAVTKEQHGVERGKEYKF